MIRYALTLVSLAALAGGCASSSGPLSENPSSDQQAQLAAYAASNHYPTNVQASSDLKAAAIVNKDDTITVRNFSDKTLRNSKVWINGAYVREVDLIPAHGSVVLNRSQFFNSAGRSLKDQSVSINNVQVQSASNLYTLQGPQFE